MKKIENTKVAVQVALYYFTISTLFYLLTMILPDLIFRPRIRLTTALRSPAIYFVSFIVVLIFLAILSNLLKRKVKVAISIDNKPLIFIIVGVLLIITGVTKIPMYASRIGVYLEDISQYQELGRIYGLYRTIVPIPIYLVQIGIGAYLTFMAIKRDKQIEKIKMAVDVALYYSTITTVLYLLSRILSDLFFRSSRELISQLKSDTLHYVVVVVVILFLAILSNFLKWKVQERISIDSKLLLYLIVGVVLIITGVTEIPSRVWWVFSLIYSIDNYQTTQIINYVYYNIVPIVFFALQIGIGAYFILMTKKRDKHIEETY